MRRPAEQTDPTAMFNLDSLMDIVTNVLGALFFVVVFVVLGATGIKARLTTPMGKPGDTERVHFECRGNTVVFPDLEGLREEINSRVVAISDDIGDLPTLIARLRRANIHNEHYSYLPMLDTADEGWYYSYSVRQALVPNLEHYGENLTEMARPGSAFRRRLAQLDPTKTHVYFFVRSESFEAFLAARRIATRLGFRAGWMPIRPGDSLWMGQGMVDPPQS